MTFSHVSDLKPLGATHCKNVFQLLKVDNFQDCRTTAVYRECAVFEVFMSSVPHGSPFYMDEVHGGRIQVALGGSEVGKK